MSRVLILRSAQESTPFATYTAPLVTTSLKRGEKMAKKKVALIKLQCPAGKANPSPPVGPALGQHGVNIMEFCKAFNARTQDQPGMIIPVEITVDRKSTRLNSSHVRISYAVFCLKKKKTT